MKLRGIAILFTAWFMFLDSPCPAQNVPLQNPTATFSQTSFSVSGTIDGNVTSGTWAVFDGNTGTAVAQTAVWETQTDLGTVGGLLATFQLFHSQQFIDPDHNLGRFRLSYTTDNRSTFADGLDTGGDVTANWTVLDPLTFVSTTGETFTKLGDLSLLVSGGTNNQSTYTITAVLPEGGVTGFRLEAMEDGSLPFGGPGRQSTNGNFGLSEFTVSAVPEPATLVVASGIVTTGCVAVFGWRRRQRWRRRVATKTRRVQSTSLPG